MNQLIELKQLVTQLAKEEGPSLTNVASKFNVFMDISPDIWISVSAEYNAGIPLATGVIANVFDRSRGKEPFVKEFKDNSLEPESLEIVFRTAVRFARALSLSKLKAARVANRLSA